MKLPVYLSSEDHSKLRLLLAAVMRGKRNVNVSRLLDELGRAIVLEPSAMPNRIVRLGSRVEIEDLDSGDIDAYTLCMPDRADAEQGQLSVLAPIGTALLGYGEGDVIEWETPGGLRRLRIRSVAQPALV